SIRERYNIDGCRLDHDYSEYRNHTVDLFARYGFVVANQNLQWNIRGFAHLKPPSDDFFLDYYGGLTGMRSYPFFTLGGYRTAYSTVSWHIPMWKRIDKQLNRFTIDKVYT